MLEDETTLGGETEPLDDVTSAFLHNLTGEEPVKKEPEEGAEEGEETSSEAPEEGEAGEPDPDDAEFELKDGDTVSKAKLRDLKAAFQDRAATDAARVEAASAGTRAALEAGRAQTALTTMMDKAKARWEPYAKIDFLALSRDPSIDQETFQLIRTEASSALADFQFLTVELDKAHTATQQSLQQVSHREAEATIKELSDPVKGIPGWSQAVYGELLDYAQTLGATPSAAKAMTAAWGFRVLHKAMMFDKNSKAAAGKVEKVVNKPTKTLKGSGQSTATAAVIQSRKDVVKAMREAGGSVDATADAFYATSRGED